MAMLIMASSWPVRWIHFAPGYLSLGRLGVSKKKNCQVACANVFLRIWSMYEKRTRTKLDCTNPADGLLDGVTSFMGCLKGYQEGGSDCELAVSSGGYVNLVERQKIVGYVPF